MIIARKSEVFTVSSKYIIFCRYFISTSIGKPIIVFIGTALGLRTNLLPGVPLLILKSFGSSLAGDLYRGMRAVYVAPVIRAD
jgi:hypothetical protein